jgi:hypothetical protein
MHGRQRDPRRAEEQEKRSLVSLQYVLNTQNNEEKSTCGSVA